VKTAPAIRTLSLNYPRSWRGLLNLHGFRFIIQRVCVAKDQHRPHLVPHRLAHGFAEAQREGINPAVFADDVAGAGADALLGQRLSYDIFLDAADQFKSVLLKVTEVSQVRNQLFPVLGRVNKLEIAVLFALDKKPLNNLAL
jgi:hypothetical protein